MPPERWRQIEDLFNAAVEREPGARKDFLKAACPGDESLIRAVESLLDQDAKEGELLSEPIGQVADEMLDGDSAGLSFSPGSMAGPYRVTERLGAGGMGDVYLARDTRLNRDVAIKTLRARFTARFEREARAISALNHPHICTLYDVGSQDGFGYLVMEYVEGEALKGPLRLGQALPLAIQIAGALEAAHAKGVLHRDLKPGNILVTKGGVKLLDFGLAKFVPQANRPAEETATVSLTGAGQIVGTLAYMSPEQLEGKRADVRSDIFALGVVLYEMLTGRRAFDAPTQIGLMSAILKDDPPSLTSLQPAIPKSLDRAVQKCMAKDPARRWQTVSDFRDELVWIADRDSAAQRAMPRRSVIPWIVAAGASAGFAGLAAWNWRSRNEPALTEPVRLRLAAPEWAWPQRVVNKQSPALSPVGGVVARIAIGERGPMVWVQRLDSLTARPLPGTECASMVFWSPDGRFIGFWSAGQLKQIPAEGGTPLPICDLPEPWSATWNQNGIIMASAGASQPAWLVTVKSGAIKRWKAVFFPKFLPDGKHVLYTKNDPATGTQQAFVEEYSTGAATPLMLSGTQVIFAPEAPGRSRGHLVYGRNGTLLAQRFDADKLRVSGDPVPVAEEVPFFQPSGWSEFDASPGILLYSTGSQRAQFTWLDRRGRKSRDIGDPQEFWAFFRLSPDGGKLAFDVFDFRHGTADIWVHDVAKATLDRVTFEPGLETSPIWSPNGKRLVFLGSQGGGPMLIEKALGDQGAGDSFQRGFQVPRDWSPDGRWIACQSLDRITNAGEIWVAAVAERKLTPLLQTQFDNTLPAFSPNSDRLAFCTNEHGRAEVYVQRFEAGDPPKLTGERYRVSREGGQSPRWRRDGKELFFLSSGRQMMATAVGSGPPVSFGDPTPLFPMPPSSPPMSPGFDQYDVTADGQRFLVVTRGVAGTLLQVVVNWQSGLPK